MRFERRTIHLAGGLGAEPPASATWTPSIDIHEGPEGLVLEADIPGATEDSLGVELEDNVLNLRARVVRPVPPGARLLYEESRVVEYARSFILSDEVSKDAIRAELKNGVLRLILPRADRPRARKIEVKSS